MTIPAGVTVCGTVREIQRDPRYWHNPEEFIPERYTHILWPLFYDIHKIDESIIKNRLLVSNPVFGSHFSNSYNKLECFIHSSHVHIMQVYI